MAFLHVKNNFKIYFVLHGNAMMSYTALAPLSGAAESLATMEEIPDQDACVDFAGFHFFRSAMRAGNEAIAYGFVANGLFIDEIAWSERLSALPRCQGMASLGLHQYHRLANRCLGNFFCLYHCNPKRWFCCGRVRIFRLYQRRFFRKHYF